MKSDGEGMVDVEHEERRREQKPRGGVKMVVVEGEMIEMGRGVRERERDGVGGGKSVKWKRDKREEREMRDDGKGRQKGRGNELRRKKEIEKR